jgi:hypothetical protein
MNIEITPAIFVKNIIFVKKYFYLFGELRRLLKDDNDFCLTKTTNNIYIENENIMNLSFWFYDYFHNECNLKEETRKLSGLWKIAKSAGWFLPHEKICFISERPNKLNRDDRGRLHSENDAAICYPDGWCIYAWHGVRVPGFVIMQPEKITVALIESEKNQEIKRVMIERYGMGRYMEDSGCKEIHRDEFGILLSKERNDMTDMRMVRVVNGSIEGLWSKNQNGVLKFTPDLKEGKTYKKEYFLRVPPETKTALEGVAWTYNMLAEEYKQLTIRT